jgi:signal peptide peptidase SppA
MFGGTSMVNAKKAVRESAAMYDSGKIKGIMLAIDSPGGTVAGTEELASEVARVAGTNCPIIAYIEDMGCSAAYWIASQADSIYANKTALVGNIGVLSVLKDTTGAYQQAGIKVIPVATGKYKGMGAEGTPITDEHVAEAQRLVNEMNLPFLDAVASGRGMTPKQLESVADGRAHVASTAKDMRLIDGISSFDSILERIHSMNADQFKAFAAENPEDQTVKDIHAKGFKAGAAQGLADARAKFTELQSAFPGRADFVIAQFSKGNDVLTAKGELADVLAGELKAKNEALATATADIAKMKANRGADPITGTTQAAASQADPVKVFNDKVAEAVKGGMTDAKAVNHVAKADPALYAEYLAAANAKATKAA